MDVKKNIADVMETIRFYENESAEFTASRDAAVKKLEELGEESDENEREDLNEEIKFFQEFIDSSQDSLGKYRARLDELQKK
jgi:predicted  nucleic acid-binding Zn-ribbon protein